MKKLISIVSALILGVSVFAQEAPVHPDGKACVISLSKGKKHAEDEFILINQTFIDLMDVSVEVYNPKKQIWIEYGVGEFRKINDVDRIDSKYSGKLKKFSHAALIPSTGEIKAESLIENDDFKVFVQDAKEQETGASVEFSKPSGKFKDKIRLISRSDKIRDSIFVIYGVKGEEKKFIGTAYLHGANDTCFVESYENVTDFEKYIVARKGDDPFTAEAHCERNDLYIYVK